MLGVIARLSQAFEVAVQKPGLELLKNSGLERVEGLKKDIAFIKSTYGLSSPAPSAAATDYASFLQDIEEDGVFVVHFYNYYFAHTAGGRMIGQKVMDEVFGGHVFEFYKWDRDVKEILAEVKGQIDVIANTWTREQKDASLAATPETFQKSGALLRVLVGKARERVRERRNTFPPRCCSRSTLCASRHGMSEPPTSHARAALHLSPCLHRLGRLLGRGRSQSHEVRCAAIVSKAFHCNPRTETLSKLNREVCPRERRGWRS